MSLGRERQLWYHSAEFFFLFSFFFWEQVSPTEFETDAYRQWHPLCKYLKLLEEHVTAIP